DLVPPDPQLVQPPDDVPAGDRGVELDRAGGEQQLAEVDEAPGQPAEVGLRERVGDDRRAQAGQGDDPAAALAADGGVVGGDVLPVGHGLVDGLAGVGE